jgi:hypothetical protein
MNNLFLPKCIDNQYRGKTRALWCFWVVILVRGMQGLALIVGGPSIVRDADGIPLETFPITASQSIVTMFLVTGMSRLILSLVGIVVFLRYRSAIALMFTVLALDQIGKELLLHIHPLFRVGNPAGPTVNLVLLFLTLLGLVLSLWTKSDSIEKS